MLIKLAKYEKKFNIEKKHKLNLVQKIINPL